MTSESRFIAMMREIAGSPAAHGLRDDVATLEIGIETLIISHDMMVQGVHWLPHADPANVAWKLVAANLSDLAAKGATPLGVMLGFTLGDDDWDIAFARGLKRVLAHYDTALLGGDTVGGGDGARTLGMTAIGRATHLPVPLRRNARAGDALYVTGVLGDAKAGFELETGDAAAKSGTGQVLRDAFNRPHALLDTGQRLAPVAHAMMDVSDGLFIDASRMAAASHLAVQIELSHIPLSPDYIGIYGDHLVSRVAACSWGDDYQLLFASENSAALPVAATKIGYFTGGDGLSLTMNAIPVPLPSSLGFQH